MNPQGLSQWIAPEFYQLKQSLVDKVAIQLRDDTHLGRDAAEPILLDRHSAASDTNLDGPVWSTYLTGAKQTLVLLLGQPLSDLLGKPPELTLIQQTKTELPLYAGVSPSPLAGLQRITDKQLTAVQRELEPTVYLIVNAVVHHTQQLEYLHTTTAFVRSTFEDIQQRRSAIPSKRKHKLNVRLNDGTTRLVSKNENKLLALQYLNHKNRYPKKQQRRRQQGQRQRENSAQPQRWRLSSARRVGEGEGKK